ncbi:DUF3551 domain-containing protein [Bradyrhizobium niftali]|jgi:hypothetical protein|nr:DUF3551 domain-containing protein [Bradyrhizobium niftali]
MSRVVGVPMFAAVALSGLVVAGSPAHGKNRHYSQPQATGIQDRYCLQGRRWGYPGNCLFSTYSQCMATASGTIDSCGLNPTYAFQEWKGPR